jgi:hypothetical protein
VKKGFHFPASAGFKNSSGGVQNVSGYTRAVPKKATGGMVRNAVGRSGPKIIPQAQPEVEVPMTSRSSPKMPPQQIRQAPVVLVPRPIRGGALAYAQGGFVKQGDGTMKIDKIGDQGNAVVKRGDPPFAEVDKEYGGKGPLRSGYKTGGAVSKGDVKKIAASAINRHVGAPAPKGHKGFSKVPMFGKRDQK